MKDPDLENPYVPPRSSASTTPLSSGDATAGRWTLIILFGGLLAAEILTLISAPELIRAWQMGIRVSTTIALVAVLYRGFRWARYLWLALLSVIFWMCCLRLWSARQPNPVFVAVTIYVATFFCFLAFSRNVLAFLDAQRQRRISK